MRMHLKRAGSLPTAGRPAPWPGASRARRLWRGQPRRAALALGLLVSLALLCGCAGAPPAAAEQTVAQGATVLEHGAEPAADWSEYAPFGLVWDEERDALTFEGRRVRYFRDLWPVGDDAEAGREHLDEAGTVDVRALRDLTVKKTNPDGSYDPSGELLGLEADSQEEFDSRDLDALLHPAPAATALEGEPLSPEEQAAVYAAYAPFGLTYDAEGGCLWFNGEKVRRFQDILSTNGEAPASGRFRGCLRQSWTDGGTVDVRAIRDYGTPDADGYGALLGVEACSQAEFDGRSPDGAGLETQKAKQKGG